MACGRDGEKGGASEEGLAVGGKTWGGEWNTCWVLQNYLGGTREKGRFGLPVVFRKGGT